MTDIEVAAARYVTPVVILAPWWRRGLRDARAGGWRVCTALAVAGGVAYFLLVAVGAQLSSATHVSIINLGMAPLLLAALSRHRWWGRPPPRTSMAGIVLIGGGVLALAVGTPGSLRGVGVLFVAALLWAVYTAAQHVAGMAPTSVALVTSTPSAVLASGMLVAAPPTSVPALSDVALFVVVQGIGSGVVSALAYALAIRRLGSARAAAFGATTPIVVLAASTQVLHQTVTATAITGLLIAVAGVVVHSRDVRRQPASQSPSSQSTNCLEVIAGAK